MIPILMQLQGADRRDARHTFAWKRDEWQKDLKEFGCYMGKFIYIMDAYEDIGDDVKKEVI